MKRAGNSPSARSGARCVLRSDDVIAPRDQFPVRVHGAREVVIPRAAIRVVLDVVFARPEQLHRHAGHLFRDRRRLDHVVVGQATAKAAAGARHVNRDVVRL